MASPSHGTTAAAIPVRGGTVFDFPVLPWASPGRGHTPSPIPVGAARGSDRFRMHRSARFGSDRARACSRAWPVGASVPSSPLLHSPWSLGAAGAECARAGIQPCPRSIRQAYTPLVRPRDSTYTLAAATCSPSGNRRTAPCGGAHPSCAHGDGQGVLQQAIVSLLT